MQFIKKTIKLDKLIVLTKSDKIQWEKTNTNVIQIYNPTSIHSSTTPNLAIKRFIAVGRLEDQKGFDLLIPAWSIIHKYIPDWTLDIYGCGSKYNEI